MNGRRLFAVFVATLLSAVAAGTVVPLAQSGPRIEVTIAQGARTEATTGMVYVAISRDNTRTPIEQASPTGAPLFSKYIDAMRAGTPVPFGAADRGHPLASLSDLPAGEYWMQPFVNVYTRFPRADGKTVWLHMDQWEGQNWKRSPGNVYGEPVQVSFDPKSNVPIKLIADQVIPPIVPPPDTAQVKHLKIESRILSKWWGHSIYLGATVLLPKDYERHPDVRYPVNYEQGHFSLRVPGGFGSGGAFDTLWMADDTPRMIYVTLQHPSPYYDDSYGVNSENNGPFGDAIMEELLPAVEAQFRVIREPWARMVSGGSTGGWIAAAHQIFYPDFYGGSFASCPDAVDFRSQIVDIYHRRGHVPGGALLGTARSRTPRPAPTSRAGVTERAPRSLGSLRPISLPHVLERLRVGLRDDLAVRVSGAFRVHELVVVALGLERVGEADVGDDPVVETGGAGGRAIVVLRDVHPDPDRLDRALGDDVIVILPRAPRVVVVRMLVDERARIDQHAVVPLRVEPGHVE